MPRRCQGTSEPSDSPPLHPALHDEADGGTGWTTDEVTHGVVLYLLEHTAELVDHPSDERTLLAQFLGHDSPLAGGVFGSGGVTGNIDNLEVLYMGPMAKGRKKAKRAAATEASDDGGAEEVDGALVDESRTAGPETPPRQDVFVIPADTSEDAADEPVGETGSGGEPAQPPQTEADLPWQCRKEGCGRRFRSQGGEKLHSYNVHPELFPNKKKPGVRPMGNDGDSGSDEPSTVQTADKTKLRGKMRQAMNRIRKLPREERESLLPELETCKEYLRTLTKRSDLSTDQMVEMDAELEDIIVPAIADAEGEAPERPVKKSTGVVKADDEDEELKELKKQERNLRMEEEKDLMRLKIARKKLELEQDLERMKAGGVAGTAGSAAAMASTLAEITVSTDEKGKTTYKLPYNPLTGPPPWMAQQNQPMGAKDIIEIVTALVVAMGSNKPAGKSQEELEHDREMREKQMALEKEVKEKELAIRAQENANIEKKMEEVKAAAARPSDMEYYQFLKEKARAMGIEQPKDVDADIKLKKTETGLGIIAGEIQNINKKTDQVLEFAKSVFLQEKQKQMQGTMSPHKGTAYDITPAE